MYRRFLRPGWIGGHLLVLLAVLVCLRLGWWQWNRSHDSDGTIQNLGYALLWPIFGGAFIFMWIRFLQLELVKDADDEAVVAAAAAELAALPEPGDQPATERSSGPVPAALDDPDRVTSGTADLADPEDDGSADGDPGDSVVAGEAPLRRARTPSRGFTVAVSMVGDDEDEDPELTEYNRALAALAEKDRRRAR